MITFLIVLGAIWLTILVLAYVGTMVKTEEMKTSDKALVALFILLLPVLVAAGAGALLI